jgi:amino acid adenylation domain-containing protein
MVFLLQHLLEDSAAKFPDRVALSYQGSTITYKRMNVLANQLGHILQKSGAQRGDRIGIYLEKSIDAVVAILGILKAGAVYVPLDPAAPALRVAYIVENCGITCLITSPKRAESIDQMFTQKCPLTTVILMQEDDSSISQQPLSQPAFNTISYQEIVNCPEAKPPVIDTIWTDLAYILYTSGSTGNPKGVIISHLNALTFINWAADTFDFSENDVFSSHAPLHFDLSIFDIFVALQAGAEIAIVPEEISYFPFRLVEWIHENRISTWYSVPSILTMMLLKGGLGRFKFEPLRYIIFAGEVFPVKYLKSLMSALPSADYYNLYGPTETNVITYYHVPRLAPELNTPIPIGIPCANMQLFILDNDGALVSETGKEGELYARGTMVARGYWGNSAKTNEVFLDRFNGAHFGERIYKTGDIVKQDEEGNLLFVGRRDHMIKSRGYRIELGEIENVLYNHPSIKEVAAIAVPEEEIGNRIKAFVSLKEGEAFEPAVFRSHCAKYLPKYMIPEAFEFCEALPKTSTGKVDKKVLADSVLGRMAK